MERTKVAEELSATNELSTAADEAASAVADETEVESETVALSV